MYKEAAHIGTCNYSSCNVQQAKNAHVCTVDHDQADLPETTSGEFTYNGSKRNTMWSQRALKLQGPLQYHCLVRQIQWHGSTATVQTERLWEVVVCGKGRPQIAGYTYK